MHLIFHDSTYASYYATAVCMSYKHFFVDTLFSLQPSKLCASVFIKVSYGTTSLMVLLDLLTTAAFWGILRVS